MFPAAAYGAQLYHAEQSRRTVQQRPPDPTLTHSFESGEQQYSPPTPVDSPHVQQPRSQPSNAAYNSAPQGEYASPQTMAYGSGNENVPSYGYGNVSEPAYSHYNAQAPPQEQQGTAPQQYDYRALPSGSAPQQYNNYAPPAQQGPPAAANSYGYNYPSAPPQQSYPPQQGPPLSMAHPQAQAGHYYDANNSSGNFSSQNNNYQHQSHPPSQSGSGGYAAGATHMPGRSGNNAAEMISQEQLVGHSVRLVRRQATNRVSGDDPSIPRISVEHMLDDMSKTLPCPPSYKPVSRNSVRATFSTVPHTPALADAVQFPVCVVTKPFAEDDFALVNFAEIGEEMTIVRCKKCLVYINPYTTFCERGNRWQCIFCKTFNATPPNYHSPLDAHTGQRVDLASRPELTHSSVELVASDRYMTRPPQRPCWLLILDCTANAVNSGLLKGQCAGALATIEKLKDDESAHIGFMGYNSSVYFFPFHEGNETVEMVSAPEVVQDIAQLDEKSRLEPIELPCTPDEIVVPIRKYYKQLVALLTALPGVFQHTKDIECAFGPAIVAGVSLLSMIGGKIIASVSVVPSLGEGKLKSRCDKKLFHKPKENTMCAVNNDWYKQRALACSNAQISVDVIANGMTETDLTTIAPLARFTAGHVYRIKPSLIGGVSALMQQAILRDTCFEAVLRVRCSTGVSVTNCYGHCYVRSPDLFTLPIGDSDSTFAFQLNVNAAKTPYVYVQVALLCTTRQRERRLRVHTMQFKTADTVPAVLKSADDIALGIVMAKMCIDYTTNTPFQQAQEKTTNLLISGLKNARKFIRVSNQPNLPGILIMPEPLKYLPSIIHGFFRNPACRFLSNYDTTPDERVASMASFMSNSVESLVACCTGWTFCVYSQQANPQELPKQMPSSQQSFRSDGIYVVHVGESIIVWYGKKVHPSILAAFRIAPAANNGGEQQQDVAYDLLDDIVKRYESLIATLRNLSRGALIAPLLICAQGTVLIESLLTVSLMDDDGGPMISLATFLSNIQSKVME